MLLLAILIVPLVAGAICALTHSTRALEWLNVLALAAVAVLGGFIIVGVLERGSIQALNGFLYADALSALVIGTTAFVSLVCSVYAVGFFRVEREIGRITTTQKRRYYVLTPFFVFAMLMVTLANNLGVMWVAIEGTTLASVLLIAFYNDKTSLEAAWKYIMIGSVGITLALFGTVLTYFAAAGVLGSESTTGLNWSVLLTKADQFNQHAMRLAFVMAALGYGTKAGLAPMHTWKPDAYSEAPLPASALLAASVLNCAVYGILRFYVLTVKCAGPAFPGKLLLFFGAASMVVAVPFVLVQRNFRRLLAYSSIEHAGIMVTAVGFGGRLGLLGAMLHMMFHATTKPLLFFCMGDVQQYFRTPYLRKVRGAIRCMPISATLLVMVTMAVTGVPPFSLFQSEFTILTGGFSTAHILLSMLFIGCVVAIFAGFLQHIVQMVFGTPRTTSPTITRNRWKLGASCGLAVVILAIGLHLPQTLFDLAQRAADVVGGTR